MGFCGRSGCLLFLTMQWAWQGHSLRVKFQNNQTLSVALNRILVLEALIAPDNAEVMVIWDRVPESGQGQPFRLYPAPTKNPRVSTERQDRILKVVNFTKEDYGRYIVTVTDRSGSEDSASRVVKESEVPPNVSIPLLCEVSHDSNQWDTPTFVWLKDGEEFSDKTYLSADGSKLYPPKDCACNYTCRVTSSLGTSSSHFYNSGCNTKPEGGTTPCVPVWVLVVVIVTFLGIIGIIIWKTRRDSRPPPVPAAERRPMNQQHSE